jgi:uncharacterized protein with FMN-binding domain
MKTAGKKRTAGARWLIGPGIALAVVVLAAGGMYLKMTKDAQAGLAALRYADVDMGRVADGAYQGEADAGLVYAKVAVDVRDHAIQDVKILEHRNGRGGAAEAITGAMVAQNRYDVDAVSGATLSSQTIKSAVSLALKQGEQ